MAKVAFFTRQARQVRIESKLSPEDRLIDDVIVVENRMYECLFGLIVVHENIGRGRVAVVGQLLFGVLALDTEIVTAEVEVVRIVHASQIDGRGQILGGQRPEFDSRD